MSCPDWTALVAHRFVVDGEPPAGWRRALDHLASCGGCRGRALALDPTLALLGPAPASLSAAERTRLVGDLKALRRAEAVGRRLEGAGRGRRRAAGWAAAAVLAVSLSLAAGVASRFAPGDNAPPSPPGPFAEGLVATPAVPPLVEALDRPQARVYELGQDDFSLVMIVDESLDV